MTAPRLTLGAFFQAQTLLVFLLVLFLAGCGATFDYDGLRALDAQGDDFNAAAAREYRDFALFEADEMYDWPDAAHFGAKAMLAAAGGRVRPEKPGDWSLPGDKVGELTAARVRLMAVMDRDASKLMPQPAARAQTHYDCWLEQQEENWQAGDIAQCRDGFYAALTAMEGRLILADGPGPAIPAAISRQGGAADPVGRAFAVFFPFDSAQLDTAAAEALDRVARLARQGASVRIVLGGHADRAGPAPYNMALSLARAETVLKALAERGIESKRIATAAHGESRPLVATPDGVREPRNRRVEITVGPASPL